jgi:hypothetical protein
VSLMQSVPNEQVVGKLTMFDRMIFHGHLSSLYPQGAFKRFLDGQGVLLKEFGPYVERATAAVKAHAAKVAAEAGRPFTYLQSATTKASGQSKEDLARAIAARDGITQGLVCVFSVLENCFSFEVRGNRASQRLEVVRRRRKCLHLYFYLIDAEFGWMHVRVQTWFPFQIQVYLNGREWLSRRLTELAQPWRRYDNAFTHLADLDTAQALCDGFAHRDWPRVLNAFARQFNPLLPTIAEAGFGGYYWSLDQCEVATDVMFTDRHSLLAIFPELYQHAILHFSAEDVLRFLGRKLHPNFQGEVTTDAKKRPEGRRVKHRCKQNSIKMYDKDSVLRVETTINNPREFKVLRLSNEAAGTGLRRWCPLNKGVAYLWRHFQVGAAANERYLSALAQVQRQGEAVAALDGLCRCRTANGKHVARLNPVTDATCALFRAVMAGEHTLNGFRNRDIAAYLYPSSPRSAAEAKRRCTRVGRLIAQLRGHGLIAKIQRSRRYRPTPYGLRVMAAALHARNITFPASYLAA